MRCGHAALSKVADAEMKSTHHYFNGDVISETEEIYQTTLDFMSECLEEQEPPVSPANASSLSFAHATPSAFSLSHLPPIKLPPFDGKYDE
ncbi:hypothetical protein X777_07311 [Ooceraea biroi]|uniref:Uncharacterized protein n=1 Tax=Ooceraea biroi TaxID=2015173 RepID=A0A026X0Z6_OOCBI|nr:hypothetical protein X777_07311 [Ooceraea biroi]